MTVIGHKRDSELMKWLIRAGLILENKAMRAVLPNKGNKVQ